MDQLEGVPTGMNWDDLKGLAKEALELQEDLELDILGVHREESGEAPEVEDSSNQPGIVEASPKGLSKPTKARARAISDLSALLSGDLDKVAPIDPMKLKVRMRGGTNGVPPRWVALLEVEVWVPDKEVARVYRNLQRRFLVDRGSKTEEGTFALAQFAWREQRLNGGKLPSWPTLFKRWNQQHPDKPFKTFNSFRQCCVRGMEAAVPRYSVPELDPPPQLIKQQIRERKERMMAKLEALAETTNNAPLFEEPREPTY